MSSLRKRLAIVCLGVLLIGGMVSSAKAGKRRVSPCKATAQKMLQFGISEAKASYWLARAQAENLPTWQERREAKNQAREDWREDIELSNAQFEARLELCEDLEEVRYHPEINPEDFVEGIDNPFLPLIPGTTLVYEGETDEGTEQIVYTVTDETKDILGVTCIVVRDTVFLDGVLKEDTFDWFAQDAEGNVWYFGELSRDYEDGELVSLEGSWKSGVDGAKPGIVMEASPQVGDVYRQEYFLGEAEDAAGVEALDESVDVTYGSFDHCLKTREFTPIDPEVLEYKFYAPGVGMVLEVNVDTGERVELVDIIIE